MNKLIFFLLLTLLVFHCSPVCCCEVGPNYKKPTIQQKVSAASHVIEGSAIEIKNTLNRKYGRAAQVVVSKRLKGKGPKEIIIYNFGWGPDCKNIVPQEKSIFFTTQLDSSTYILNYLGIFDAAIQADEHNSTEQQVTQRNNDEKSYNERVNLTVGSSVALIASKFVGGGRLPLALGAKKIINANRNP